MADETMPFRLESLEQRFDRVDVKLDGIQSAIEKIATQEVRITHIESDMADVKKRQDKLDDRLDEIAVQHAQCPIEDISKKVKGYERRDMIVAIVVSLAAVAVFAKEAYEVIMIIVGMCTP